MGLGKIETRGSILTGMGLGKIETRGGLDSKLGTGIETKCDDTRVEAGFEGRGVEAAVLCNR